MKRYLMSMSNSPLWYAINTHLNQYAVSLVDPYTGDAQNWFGTNGETIEHLNGKFLEKTNDNEIYFMYLDQIDVKFVDDKLYVDGVMVSKLKVCDPNEVFAHIKPERGYIKRYGQKLYVARINKHIIDGGLNVFHDKKFVHESFESSINDECTNLKTVHHQHGEYHEYLLVLKIGNKTWTVSSVYTLDHPDKENKKQLIVTRKEYRNAGKNTKLL